MTTEQTPVPAGPKNRLAGCGPFIAFKLVTVVLLIGYGLVKADSVGVGPGVMLKQPALAAAAIGVMAHTGYDFVSVDRYRETVTLRHLETGQTHTLPPGQILRGDIVESGRKVGKLLGKLNDSGMPAWIPEYPGAGSSGVVHQDIPDGRKGVASLEVFGAIARVAAHYEVGLREAGLALETEAGDAEITVKGRDEYREIKVVVTARGAKAGIRITFTERG